MDQEKNNKGFIGALIAIIVLLLCVVLYLLFGKDMLNSKTNDNSTTTTTTSTTTTTTKEDRPTENIQKPKELENAIIEEFVDVVTGDKYYLAMFKLESNGDIYNPTEHVIYDSKYVKLETIPELKTSHIWNKSGTSILNGGKEITAELRENKIYSLARNADNECDFVQYEIYVSNGKIIKNIIQNYADGTVEVSGEKC